MAYESLGNRVIDSLSEGAGSAHVGMGRSRLEAARLRLFAILSIRLILGSRYNCGTMSLIDQIQKDLVAAMKAKDELRLSCLRMVKTALTLKQTEKMGP